MTLTPETLIVWAVPTSKGLVRLHYPLKDWPYSGDIEDNAKFDLGFKLTGRARLAVFKPTILIKGD